MNHDRRARVAAAIIAGGAGRRMGGVDKTTLTIAGRTILERQLETLTPRFSRVLLVTAPPSSSSSPPEAAPRSPLTAAGSPFFVHDRGAPGRGPIAGIDAALAALLDTETDVVCVAGDMPLLAPALLELLRDAAPEAMVLVPRLGAQQRPEPLMARYQRGCAPAISAALAAGAFKASALLATLPVHWLEEPAVRAVDPGLHSFENANTASDLARIESLARQLDDNT
jgi:molybdopterin-guanine dinucleotide biosynthesis protein A